MANEYGNLGTLSPEDYAQQQAITRQQRMAEMLMSQNQQPQGQMVSGRYVAPSFFQNILPLVNTYVGKGMLEEGDIKQQKLAEAIRARGSEDLQNMLQTYKGTSDYKPAVMPEIQRDDMGNVMPPVENQVGVAPNPMAAILRGSNSYNPIAKQFASTLLTQMTKAPEYKTAKAGESILEIGPDGKTRVIHSTPKEADWVSSTQYINGKEVHGWVNKNSPNPANSFVQGSVKPDFTPDQLLRLQDEGILIPNTSNTGTSPIIGNFPLSRGIQPGHNGKDIATPVGTPAVATHEGVVRYNTSDKKGYGNAIDIVNPQTGQVMARYAHLSAFDVPEGTVVKPGQILGKTGGVKGSEGAGNSTGPHSHYEDLTKAPTPPSNLSPKAQREWLKEYEINRSKPLTGDAEIRVTGSMNFQDAIDNYRNILSNFKTTDMAIPEKRAILNSAYNTMLLQGKEANKLGVLNGGDERILKSLIPNPNDINTLTISKQTLDKFALDQKKFAGNIIKNAYEVSQKPVPQSIQSRLSVVEQPKEKPTNQVKINPELFKYMTPEQQALFTNVGK